MIFVMALFSSSCKDELMPKVYSQLTTENFPKTESDVNAMLTSIYAIFGPNFGVSDVSTGEGMQGLYCSMYSWYHLSSASTDEIVDQWFSEYKLSWGSAFDTYDFLYGRVQFVARATDLLNIIEKTDLTDSFKKSATAETKTLRAWVMFLLYDWYGPVNVILDPAKLGVNTFEPRPSKEEYFGAMIKDLEDAIPFLLAKTNLTGSWGRVNQGLARMLLLKLYMNDHQWDKAKVIGEELLTMGYSLMPSYKDVFAESGNNEVIWASPAGPSKTNSYLYTNLPSNCKSLNGVEVDPGWEGYYMPWSFYDKFPQGDKRLETIAAEYYDVNGNLVVRGEGLLSLGAVATKYVLPHEQSRLGTFDQVAFRYADVLLSMAEIENEINGPTTLAVSYLKQVTDRVDIDIPSSVTDSKNDFRDFLLDERGRELYCEGWRRQDMIRFGKFIEWGQSQGLPAESYMTLYPLPPKAISEAKGVVEQNPGY